MGSKEALIYSSGRAKIAEDQTQDLEFQEADLQSRSRPQVWETQKPDTWNGNLGGAPKDFSSLYSSVPSELRRPTPPY